jgi:hypothetical protein
MASAASARSATLLAASDAWQIEELQVAKVLARNSSFWLGVRLRGKVQLALVTGDSSVESAPAADAWLRALDFTTRVRVAAPPGPLSSCGSNQEFGLVDTGLPDPPVVDVKQVVVVGSELELRRALQDASLPVDSEHIARFVSSVAAPFRVALYDVPETGGRTAALRLLDVGSPSAAPQIETVGRDAVPVTLLGLASAAVLPPETSSGDASEFAVTYRAWGPTDPSSDYVTARASWLLAHPQRWLVETQNSSSLFAWTALAPKALLAPVVVNYFQGLAGSCLADVQGAYAHGSQQAADYVCANHDDLALSLSQLGFGDLRVSRLYGSLGSDGVTFRVVETAARSPLLRATDLDDSACPPPSGDAPSSGVGMSPPDPQPPVVVSDPGPGPGGHYAPDPGTPVYTDDGGCNVTIVDSESCTGNSSSGEPGTTDSCSGDSSSGEPSTTDSCSGDSSSSDSNGSDSCSGDSSGDSSDDSCGGNSDSSSDSGGCSKNDGYDGDTCTGNSQSSAQATRSSSAALRSGGAPHRQRPRRVRLSLLTLLAAALALPLRRLRALRF